MSRSLRNAVAGTRSVSPGESTNPSAAKDSNSPLTLRHFNALMEKIDAVAKSVVRMEERQEDILTQLSTCNAAISEHSKMLSKHQSCIEKHQGDIEAISEVQTELALSISDIRSQLANSNSANSSNIVPELLDRIKRSHNIIITNVPDGGDESVDLPLVRNIVNLIQEDAGSCLVSARRLPSRDGARPRWMRVSFSNSEVVSSILRRKSALMGHSQYRNMVIFDDKTKSQVAELNALRGELGRRQRNGERNLTIKYVRGTPRIVSTGNSTVSPKN